MFTLSVTTAFETALLIVSITSVLSPRLSRATRTVKPKYEVRLWDKNGDFHIKGLQCPNASQCSWYHNVQRVRTRVSNSSTLNLTAQNSEYDEYYLLNDQNKSIVQYALVVPNSNAGSPYESNFISLHVCQTRIPNYVEFSYTININKRAIDTEQHCDLRLNGLPHCAFRDRLCSYNDSDLMAKFSVRCRLNYTEKDVYISSIPMMIDLVGNLPFCSENNITYSITISTTIATSTLVVPTNDTQPASTNAAKITSATSMVSTTSSTASISQTVTSALTATPVHHIPSSLATINATHETSTPSATTSTSSATINATHETSTPSATTSEQKTKNIIAGVCATAAVTILFLLCILLIKVYLRRRAYKGKSNSNTENNDNRLQPRWKQEINDNQVDMAESLTTVITFILFYLRPSLDPFEYNEINSITNEMRKAYKLLDTICSREDDKLLIKFCDALDKAKHPTWTYLRDYCNIDSIEN